MLRFLLLLTVTFIVFNAGSQVYLHDFGTTAISSHPYTVAPGTLDPNLSNSSWSNSTGSWTSYAGASGQALSLSNSGGIPTITLTFDIASGCSLDITAFDFWRRRSSTGAQNWSMTINGTNVGSGTVPTTGSAIGSTPVSGMTGLTGTVTIVISLSGATGSGTFRLDDFTLFGSTSCGGPGNTVTISNLSSASYSVDCSTNASGTIDISSTGTFNSGNNYEIQLSDASGNFSSPVTIGTIASTSNTENAVSFTIPAGTASGSGYRIRIVSTNPAVTSADNGTDITITLSGGPCSYTPPYMTSVMINSCNPTCTEGYNEIVFGNSGDYSFDVTASNFNFRYGSTYPGTNYTDVLVNNATTIQTLNDSAGCPGLFVDATGLTIPAGAPWMLAYTDICAEALTWSGLCGTGPIYVILQNDSDWNVNGNFANNTTGIRYWQTSITTTSLDVFTIDYTTDGTQFANSDGVFATFNSTGGAASAYGDDNCNLTPVVLPVELIDFNGEISDYNELYWATASERNASNFEIEVSNDGKNWETVGSVAAAGNSTDLNSYSLSHINPTMAINYYRLTQYDLDGAYVTYTKIVSLDNREHAGDLIGIYNTLGQEITGTEKGVQIYLFSDGSTRRIFKN